jgi:hypothetical protein
MKLQRQHSFKTRPGHRPGPVTGSRVRWVDPGQPKKKNECLEGPIYQLIAKPLSI